MLFAVSRDWHHAGKDRSLLCTECRLFFKKYGEDRPLDGDKDTSSYLFKPVKEEDDTVNGKHNMRTRRGNSAVSFSEFFYWIGQTFAELLRWQNGQGGFTVTFVSFIQQESQV